MGHRICARRIDEFSRVLVLYVIVRVLIRRGEDVLDGIECHQEAIYRHDTFEYRGALKEMILLKEYRFTVVRSTLSELPSLRLMMERIDGRDKKIPSVDWTLRK